MQESDPTEVLKITGVLHEVIERYNEKKDRTEWELRWVIPIGGKDRTIRVHSPMLLADQSDLEAMVVETRGPVCLSVFSDGTWHLRVLTVTRTLTVTPEDDTDPGPLKHGRIASDKVAVADGAAAGVETKEDKP